MNEKLLQRYNFQIYNTTYIGAFFPGINAVVMITSTSLHCCAKSACSASINALLISLLYPAAVPPSSYFTKNHLTLIRFVMREVKRVHALAV